MPLYHRPQLYPEMHAHSVEIATCFTVDLQKQGQFLTELLSVNHLMLSNDVVETHVVKRADRIHRVFQCFGLFPFALF